MAQTLPASRSASIAAALAGAWRRPAPPLDISAEQLTEIAPLVLGSGAGALVWWRVRDSHLRSSKIAFRFQQAYRLHTLQAAIHEREIKKVFALLRKAGIEPILIKGWAVAQLYPEKGLRPHDDIDLIVRPDQYEAARAALGGWREKRDRIDLHRDCSAIDDRDFESLYDRSQLINLDGVDVRVPGLEDHLGILCLHLLHHGAFRPLWLCDIAAAIETRPDGFDWARCLGRNERRADWVACTIGLTHQLLGARVEETPAAARANRLPRWLPACVLKQWETPFAKDQSPMKNRAPMAAYLRNPSGALKDMRARWPNPIIATIDMEGRFNELPRLPYQLGNCVSRGLKFLGRLPKLLKQQQY
ncbi:MAG TPA: nucleotidyltransferase family protein [Blastocatellia bacterium]|nr:nucleotidyltransferase family protein [Blastocatellia bacterium]